MRLNRGRQPEARAQVEGLQVKYICIKNSNSHLRLLKCSWRYLHFKKMLAISPSPVGKSLTKLSVTGKETSRLWTGKPLTFFYSVPEVSKELKNILSSLHQRQQEAGRP
jgi:hypothetical protein